MGLSISDLGKQYGKHIDFNQRIRRIATCVR